MEIITEGQKAEFKIILMGDFNSNYDQFLNMKRSNNYAWINKIFKRLENNNLTDIISFTEDISESNPQYL